ncbi:MAG: hypothetical protein K0M66_11145 [Thiobacillus sp.]|nr:hypothetical protein [Thiobacillus sp.]
MSGKARVDAGACETRGIAAQKLPANETANATPGQMLIDLLEALVDETGRSR